MSNAFSSLVEIIWVFLLSANIVYYMSRLLNIQPLLHFYDTFHLVMAFYFSSMQCWILFTNMLCSSFTHSKLRLVYNFSLVFVFFLFLVLSPLNLGVNVILVSFKNENILDSWGVWDWHVHAAVFKMDNQQEPAVQYRRLRSPLC